MIRLRPGVALLAAALLIALAAACKSSKPAKAELPSTSGEGRKPAPEFALKDADGKVVRLSDYRGKVVMVNFWATWCGPCKIEIPWFVEFQRKHKDRGFDIIGVSMDDEGWPAVKPFMSETGMNYRVVLGNDSVAQAYGGVDALPTTFLVDREGNIASVHVGLAAKSDFEDGIEKLLEGNSGASKRAVLSPDAAGAR